ncbi:UNVERIFIED_ORG: hypothetical protein GCAPEGMB_00433 [Vibrio phage V07]
MIYLDLEQALIGALKPHIPNGVNVSWPNAELSKKGEVWFDVDNLFSDDVPITGGDSGENEIRGILQVLVKVKPNVGAKVALTHATNIARKFKAGSGVTHGNAHPVFRGAKPGPAFTSGEYYVVPLSINYYARYSRTLGVPASNNSGEQRSSFVVGETSTQVGFWRDHDIGSTTVSSLTRLSVTKSNNYVFFEDPRFTSNMSATLKIDGIELTLTRNGDRFTSSEGAQLETYLQARVGQSVSYDITV